MHSNKATSLDRTSKEMLELLPEGLRRPFYVAAMEIATPDARGARHKPLYWARVPVKLLDKKTPSLCVSKKRDIGLPSQLLKLQAGLYMPAYASVMDRLPGNFGWTPGVAAPRSVVWRTSWGHPGFIHPNLGDADRLLPSPRASISSVKVVAAALSCCSWTARFAKPASRKGSEGSPA
jgi:hypothetical protein